MINFLNTAVDLLLRWRDATRDTPRAHSVIMERVIPSVFTSSRSKRNTRAGKKKAVNQNDFTNAVLGHFLQQNANQTKARGIILSELAFESKIVTTIEKQSLRSV